MQKLLKIAMLTAFAMVFLEGCSTVTPDQVEDNQASFDASTPPQYNNQSSGFIAFTEDSKGNTTGGVLTKNARAKYNNLIDDYRVQFRQENKVELNRDDGIKSHRDSYGNRLYWIDAEHLQYFLKLNKWAKNGRQPDTMTMKIKEKF